MRSISAKLAILIALAALILPCGAGPAHAAEQQPVRVLLLTGQHFKLDAEIQKRLEAEGITLVARSMSAPLSPEMLALFEVVALPNFAGLQAPPIVPHKYVVEYLNAKRNLELIHAYVQAGGGAFFSPDMRGGGQEVAEACEALLEPWGIRVLAAQVRDDAHACCEAQYAWTTNIAKSPVTEGVRRIVYPTNMLRWDDAYATPTLAPQDKAWQIVVRGMPESTAATGLLYKTWFPVEGQKAPAIAAVRQVGKGRVAGLGVSPFYTLWCPYAEPERGWVGESNTGSIAGIFMEKGDGKNPSDGYHLLVNMLRWLAEGSRAAGLGGYTAEKLGAVPAPPSAKLPKWLSGWDLANSTPFKVLIGARSRYSEGKSSVAELANAARDAGYSILVMTETFEDFDRARWKDFLADCDNATSEDLIVLPGLDIADIYQNRYLVFGQRSFPEAFMLSEDGKALKEVQYLSLGFGTHFSAVHRPTTTPIPHHLYKFFAGIVVFTYRGGELVDNGLLAYEWQVNAASQPAPLAVHEVVSADEVAKAATTGHQFYVLADTVANAAWYLRPGMNHFWESPSLFFVSAGPMVRRLAGGLIEVEADAPITDVQLRNHHYAERRWRPNTQKATLNYYLPPSHLRWSYVYVEDAEGRSAVTPPLRSGPTSRYTWRCSDRQNFFGFAWHYTGTNLPDVDFRVPAFGTDEGRGLWPHGRGPRRGENMTVLLDFPYASPEIYITDAYVDQRYWLAQWEDVAYDSRPARGSSRARVYDGRVRYYDFLSGGPHNKRDDVYMVKEITLKLRLPVEPDGPVFPRFTRIAGGAQYSYIDPQSGEEVEGKLAKGHLDLPVGGCAGNLIALAPGIRVGANGSVGFATPQGQGGPLPVGTSWTTRYVKIPPDQLQAVRAFMGAGGKAAYELKLQRGEVTSTGYIAELASAEGGVAGAVSPAATAPFPLLVVIAGLNPNWEAAIWREGGALDPFGVFEGRGYARLDVTKGGKFYAGNIVTADEPRLRLSVLRWDANGMTLEANNPTAADVETVVRTPVEITNRLPIGETIKVPAGSTVRLKLPAAKQQ